MSLYKNTFVVQVFSSPLDNLPPHQFWISRSLHWIATGIFFKSTVFYSMRGHNFMQNVFYDFSSWFLIFFLFFWIEPMPSENNASSVSIQVTFDSLSRIWKDERRRMCSHFRETYLQIFQMQFLTRIERTIVFDLLKTFGACFTVFLSKLMIYIMTL